MCFIASPLWAGTFPELISSSTGNTYVVSTENEFNQRAASAQPGDVILVADGTYSGWQLKIPSVGTNDKPIIYTAQHPGKVTFQNGVKLFWISGSYNIIGGFNINNVDQDVILFHSGASYNRITDNKMHSIGGNGSSRGYINIREQSHYNRIDHNEVTEAEDAIRIWLPGEAVVNGPSQHTRIDHNSFKDTTPGGTSRCVLQIGQGSTVYEEEITSLEVHTIFEHNFIENHSTGYGEIISSKSSYNIIRYNEINNSYGGISLRAGEHNEVYSNYIHGPRAGAAIRISGAYNKVYNNVIDAPDKKHGIFMPRWGHRINCSSLPPTHDNIIAYNTIIDYDQYGMRIGDFDSGACRPVYNCKAFNNIIIGDSGELVHYNTDSYQSGNPDCDERDDDSIEGYNDVEISNKLFFKTDSATYGSGYNLDAKKVVGNPNLIDIFHLPSCSIAVDKGIVIPSISVDYYGNPRDGAPDIGAFEYSKVLPPRNVEAIKQ
jgi:poly(beta-D-mannuronate) lyase